MVSPSVKGLIQRCEPAEQIKAAGCSEGMRTLRGSALRALEAQRTSLAEVLRVTQEDL
jgi:type II secretory ATPase GspE/PulE/Tfp pilus assembly ATPase PilB-like protein